MYNVDLFLFLSGLRRATHEGKDVFKGEECGSILYGEEFLGFMPWVKAKTMHRPGDIHLLKAGDYFEAYFTDAVIVYEYLSQSFISIKKGEEILGCVPGADKELRTAGHGGGRFLVARVPGPKCMLDADRSFSRGRSDFEWALLGLKTIAQRRVVLLLDKEEQTKPAGPPPNVIFLSQYRKRPGVSAVQ